MKEPSTNYAGINGSSERSDPVRPDTASPPAPPARELDSEVAGSDVAASSAQARWFATTHWSVVLGALESPSPKAEAALETLCRSYWYPLYAYARRLGHGPHDAQDLTQGFFARIFEKNYLASVSPEKGKFRSFLLVSFNHFLSHERARERAAKRGGGQPLLSLNEEDAEELYAREFVGCASPEKAFERRWAITVLEQAFARLRNEYAIAGKDNLFDQLKPFLGEGAASGDYSAAASKLNMSSNAVAVAVHRLRQKYREAVRLEIGQTVGSPEQIEEEMRHLLAALAG